MHESTAGTGEFHDIATVGAAMKPNVCHYEFFERGDVTRGFAEADHIIEETFEFPMIYQYAMEPHTSVARVTDGGITLWSSSAHPFLVRSELAHMFGLPHAKVEVIVPYVGGAYGSKSYFKIEPLIVAMARKTGGRPVRLAQSVPESMLTTRRHSAKVRIKTGFKRDGTLLAREAEVVMDTGAYADNGPRVAKRAISRMIGPYKLRDCKVEVSAVYTNTVPAGSMRSIGGPQTIWALGIAHGHDRARLGVGPAGISHAQFTQPRRSIKKRRHAHRRGSAARNQSRRRCCLLERRDPKKWEKAGVSPSAFPTPKRCRFRSPCCGFLPTAAFFCSPAPPKWVKARARSSAKSSLRSCDVPIESVIMRGTDTLATPFDRSTGASRSTTVMGSAVRTRRARFAQAIDCRRRRSARHRH